MGVHYVKGDATCPQGSGPKIIVHICNNIGKWGKGFVLAISDRWKEPEQEYRKWYQEGFKLGEVQFVQVDKWIWVANMIGQSGIKTGSSGPPIRYEAVEKCLNKVAEKAMEINASVHMPRIGCGLSGGTWNKIQPIVEESLKGLDVTVYDFS